MTQNKTAQQHNNKTPKQYNYTTTQQQNRTTGNQKVMNSGRQDFSTSCRLDFRTSVSTEVSHSVSTEVSQYWRQSVSHFLEGRVFRALPFWPVLFPMSASGTGGSPLCAGRRTSGNRTWYSTRFWVPGTLYVSGLSKLCFPLREIFSVTKTACPQGGWKLLRSRRFLTGTSCAECKCRFFKMSSPMPPAIRASGTRKRAGMDTKTGMILQNHPHQTSVFHPLFVPKKHLKPNDIPVIRHTFQGSKHLQSGISTDHSEI